MGRMLHKAGAPATGQKVFLAIAAYQDVGAGCSFALAHTTAALAGAGIGFELAIYSGNCHVDSSRNRLARDFLRSDCTDLVFIDADVGWQDHALPRLMSFDRDIVAGVYPKKTDNTEFPVYLPRGELRAEADGLLKVERAPTGFLRISRRVLETLAEKARKYRSNEAKPGDPPYPLIFERANHDADGRRWSGDYAFCNKATDAGFSIYVDPELHFTHAGVKLYSGCLGDHLREAAGLDHPDFAKAVAALRSGDTSAETLAPLYGHSGSKWAATPEMLMAAYSMARQTKGFILECGSGVSTIALGLAAERSGAFVHSLEHDIDWYDKTKARLDRYNIKSVTLHYAPLKDRDGVRWYDVPRFTGPFDLVLCDGPQRRYGRSGLIKHLGWAIADAAVIIDDTNNLDDLQLAHRLAAGREVHTHDVRDAEPRQFAMIKRRERRPQPMRAFA